MISCFTTGWLALHRVSAAAVVDELHVLLGIHHVVGVVVQAPVHHRHRHGRSTLLVNTAGQHCRSTLLVNTAGRHCWSTLLVNTGVLGH